MNDSLAFIGFGEVGMAFAVPNARAYDRKVDNPTSSSSKQADYLACGVRGAESNAAPIGEASLILSVVTANEAVARESVGAIGEGALYCDLNSIAPDRKRAACGMIEASGGRYVYSMNGIELQNREFISAIREGREPHSSVGKVLPCYKVLGELDQSLPT